MEKHTHKRHTHACIYERMNVYIYAHKRSQPGTYMITGDLECFRAKQMFFYDFFSFTQASNLFSFKKNVSVARMNLPLCKTFTALTTVFCVYDGSCASF